MSLDGSTQPTKNPKDELAARANGDHINEDNVEVYEEVEVPPLPSTLPEPATQGYVLTPGLVPNLASQSSFSAWSQRTSE